jgi:hypothetical protein
MEVSIMPKNMNIKVLVAFADTARIKPILDELQDQDMINIISCENKSKISSKIYDISLNNAQYEDIVKVLDDTGIVYGILPLQG